MAASQQPQSIGTHLALARRGRLLSDPSVGYSSLLFFLFLVATRRIATVVLVARSSREASLKDLEMEKSVHLPFCVNGEVRIVQFSVQQQVQATSVLRVFRPTT